MLTKLMSSYGLHVSRMTSRHEILQLIRNLRPIETKFDLIRIGGSHDGGYLVPNDLSEISTCFSPGVDVNASFEIDLLQRFGINSHLADYSVNGPPMQFQPLSFTKKFIGPINNDIFMTLDEWVQKSDLERPDQDCLLQMDIEGHEYTTLLMTAEATLKKFRILAIEFHNTRNWGDPKFFNVVQAVFEKLLQYFYVVHIHPNNDAGQVELWDLPVPRLLEVTFLRKDRTSFEGYCKTFPHPLDRINTPSRPDLVLPELWYASNLSAEIGD